jgi:hypothetical protein
VNFRIAFIFLLALPVAAQLTPEQKVIDLQTVASLYAKQYAPYGWKVELEKFDLFDLRPWLDRARASKDDVEYLELLAEYTAKLNDIHSYYIVNSDFVADLHLFTDIYDGKVLIEQIDRSYLPSSRFDFAVGDEIVLFDGRPAMDLVRDFARVSAYGNPRSTSRWASDFLVYRPQAVIPSAGRLGSTATLLVRKADGTEKSYTIEWDKFGTPLTRLGPVPNFFTSRERGGRNDSAPLPGSEEAPASEPAFRKPWLALQNNVGRPTRNLRGFSMRAPVYRLPDNFTLRLGRNRSDYFYSGTYTAQGKRVGFLRIGNFQPVSFSLLLLPLRQFEQEIAFLKANTDVLVLDVGRNGGGFGCYAEALLQYLIPQPFQTVGAEIRPNLDLIRGWRFAVQDAQDFGEAWEVNLYSAILKDIETAYAENRGRTGPIPLCGPSLIVQPARSAAGANLAYDKPILLLTDEFTTSAGDIFAAVLQDNNRAKLFGLRTSGAGGNTVTGGAGFFSEGGAAVTQMLLTRPKAVSVQGFPSTRYIENVGVHPDIPYDYQTRNNLVNEGRQYVVDFTNAAVALANGN